MAMLCGWMERMLRMRRSRVVMKWKMRRIVEWMVKSMCVQSISVIVCRKRSVVGVEEWVQRRVKITVFHRLAHVDHGHWIGYIAHHIWRVRQ